ncbi:MAG: hypothetical protein ACFCBW_13365 [Candidatus Competibacterales bacterium]
MALCNRVIGRWTPHHCGREVGGQTPPPLEDGRCRHCGIEVVTLANSDGASLETELDFDSGELERFGVMLANGEPGSHPPEWGNDPFTDLT